VARGRGGRPLERVIRYDRRFRSSCERLGLVPGTPLARRVAATVRTLAFAVELPEASGSRALIPPTRSAWVRRVPAANQWIYFVARTEAGTDAEIVEIVSIVGAPPPPVDDL